MGDMMGKSAITCDNQSRIIHALSALAPHLNVCADADKQCVYIENSKNEEYKFLLESLGEDPEKPLFGHIERNEIEIDAIDINWLEMEAKRRDSDFTPL